ncbi:hypothetical protein ACQKFK_02580 [Bacillus mycoides]|uniref:hypothetical protein n=1 Tax=Bacillus mycoides TaxID=1405 RepID=UPI003D020877
MLVQQGRNLLDSTRNIILVQKYFLKISIFVIKKKNRFLVESVFNINVNYVPNKRALVNRAQ